MTVIFFSKQSKHDSIIQLKVLWEHCVLSNGYLIIYETGYQNQINKDFFLVLLPQTFLPVLSKTWFLCLKLDVRFEWGNQHELRSHFHVFCTFLSCFFVYLFVSLRNRKVWRQLLFGNNAWILLLVYGLTSALHRMTWSWCKKGKMRRGEGCSPKTCGNWRSVTGIQWYVTIYHLEKQLFYQRCFSPAF